LRLLLGLLVLVLSLVFVFVWSVFSRSTPRTELAKENHATSIRIAGRKLGSCFIGSQIQAHRSASCGKLLCVYPAIVVAINLLKFVPEVVEVH